MKQTSLKKKANTPNNAAMTRLYKNKKDYIVTLTPKVKKEYLYPCPNLYATWFIF